MLLLDCLRKSEKSTLSIGLFNKEIVVTDIMQYNGFKYGLKTREKNPEREYWLIKLCKPHADTDNATGRPGCEPSERGGAADRGHIRPDVEYRTALFKYYHGNNSSCGALLCSRKLFKYRHCDTPLISTRVMSWQQFLPLLCFSGLPVI